MKKEMEGGEGPGSERPETRGRSELASGGVEIKKQEDLNIGSSDSKLTEVLHGSSGIRPWE